MELTDPGSKLNRQGSKIATKASSNANPRRTMCLGLRRMYDYIAGY